MQVHCDEGVATHIGPKPCAGIREDVGEASAGERAGQQLSRDRKLIPGADTVCAVEGNMSKSASASTVLCWISQEGSVEPLRWRGYRPAKFTLDHW